MKYVLISGKQGSGKTSLQHALNDAWFKRTGFDSCIVNFADILYEMHDAVLAVLHKYWPKRDLVKDGPLLQLLGTEWGRGTVDIDIWVKCLKNRAIKMNELSPSEHECLFIVGDCRFPNEFDAFPEALTVRLEASTGVRKARCSMWRDRDDHPSETGLDGYKDKFDLLINTESRTVEDAVQIVMDALIIGKAKPC